MHRWLPSAIYLVAALCFFAAVLTVGKRHGVSLAFAVGGLLMVVIAITASRRQRRDTGSAPS